MAELVKVETATEAWDYWWRLLLVQAETGLRNTSRDGAVAGEILNATTEIFNPRKSMVMSPDRNMSMGYAIGEFLWYLSGSNKVSGITPYGKAWENLSDNGETVNSAYGYRIIEMFGFNQFDFVYELLSKDPNSRQAVIHIKDPSDTPTKDVPCTLTLQYLIRDNKLYATTNMRSNDIWLGMPYDFFTFMNYQVILATRLGVEVGTYTHNAGSLHLYSRNIPKTHTPTKVKGGCCVGKD